MKISEQQLTTLVTDLAQLPTTMRKVRNFWANMSEKLNNVGPCVKTPLGWRQVSLQL